MAAATTMAPDSLRFHPEWVTDPVPPWVFDILDKAAQREIARIHLEMTKNILIAQQRAVEAAMAVVKA